MCCEALICEAIWKGEAPSCSHLALLRGTWHFGIVTMPKLPKDRLESPVP